VHDGLENISDCRRERMSRSSADELDISDCRYADKSSIILKAVLAEMQPMYVQKLSEPICFQSVGKYA